MGEHFFASGGRTHGALGVSPACDRISGRRVADPVLDVSTQDLHQGLTACNCRDPTAIATGTSKARIVWPLKHGSVNICCRARGRLEIKERICSRVKAESN